MINSTTEITAKLDWLSVTVDNVRYPNEWTKKRAELPHGMLRYDTAVKYLDGRLELCSSDRQEMQPHIQFSGGCIDRICFDCDIDTVDVLLAMSYGRPTRIDLALDIKKGSLDISELSAHFLSDRAITSARSGLYLSGVKMPGNTLYVGAKGSEKRVRIYDKAAEQGIQDFEWTRVELQLRHASAVAVMPVVISAIDPHVAIASVINGFVSFPEIPDWVIAVGYEKLKPGRIDILLSNRRQWLLDTAAKSLANEIVESVDGKSFFDEFLSVVNNNVARKAIKYEKKDYS